MGYSTRTAARRPRVAFMRRVYHRPQAHLAEPSERRYSFPERTLSMIVNGKEVHIADVMRPAHIVQEHTTLREAVAYMIEHHCNSLVVVGADGTYAGSVSTVDIIKEVLPEYLEEDAIAARFADTELLREDAMRAQDRPLQKFMATDVAVIHIDEALIKAAVLAIKHGHGRITVVDEQGIPLGVLTRTEIKHVIGHFLDIPSALA